MLQDKKILLVRHEGTFLANAIKKALTDAGFEVAESNYLVSEIELRRSGVSLAILYTDNDIRDHQDCLQYLRRMYIDTNTKLIVIGEKDAFDEVHMTIPANEITYELYRPLEIADLVGKVMKATDDNFDEDMKKCVLVVDDDVTYIQMIREWLKDNYKVGMANSGVQAVAWLSANHADLILLDYDMPVLDGAKVLEMLRSENFSKNIPVMFLTGKNDKKTVTDVLSLKPEDYLLKSIDKEKLLTTLDHFFENRK